MSYKVSDELAELLLAAARSALDGGFLYLFAGAVPASPADALNMSTTHTEVVKISVDGDGSTGLTFDAPVDDTLSKASAETWSGTASFDGLGSAETSIDVSFFRFCTAADNGRSAGTTARLQGTVGVVGAGADMERSSVNIEGAQPVTIDAFSVKVGSVG